MHFSSASHRPPIATAFSHSVSTSSNSFTVAAHCFESKLVKVSSLLPLNLPGSSPLEFRQRPSIPEQQVIRQLPDRMIPFAVGPVGLFRRDPIHGHIHRHKPVFLVVRRLQLFQQNGA